MDSLLRDALRTVEGSEGVEEPNIDPVLSEAEFLYALARALQPRTSAVPSDWSSVLGRSCMGRVDTLVAYGLVDHEAVQTIKRHYRHVRTQGLSNPPGL